MTWIKQEALPILKRAIKEFGTDGCSRLAASLAYYAVFSIFPLILLGISILGFYLQFAGGAGVSAQEQLLASIRSSVSGDIADLLASILGQVELGAGVGAPIALVTTLMAASGVFVQLDAAFDIIWNVPEQETTGIVNKIKATVLDRGKAFAMVLAIGLLLIASLVASTVLSSLGKYAQQLPAGGIGWRILNIAISYLINVLVFALLFKYLPKLRLRWRNVLPAAFLTGFLWEVGKQLLSWYLGRSAASAYGIVGAFILLLAWIYYACLILFFGAEVSQAYTRIQQEQAQAADRLVMLPAQTAYPYVLLPPAQVTAGQKTAYAVGGATLGMVSAVLLGGVGVVLGVIRAVRRR